MIDQQRVDINFTKHPEKRYNIRPRLYLSQKRNCDYLTTMLMVYDQSLEFPQFLPLDVKADKLILNYVFYKCKSF